MIEIVQGDTRQAIRAILKDANGMPVDLTGASVRFLMGYKDNLYVDSVAQQKDATGEVWYVFNKGETDKTGKFFIQFVVTYADGREETFPHSSKGAIQIKINQRLGGLI